MRRYIHAPTAHEKHPDVAKEMIYLANFLSTVCFYCQVLSHLHVELFPSFFFASYLDLGRGNVCLKEPSLFQNPIITIFIIWATEFPRKTYYSMRDYYNTFAALDLVIYSVLYVCVRACVQGKVNIMVYSFSSLWLLWDMDNRSAVRWWGSALKRRNDEEVEEVERGRWSILNWTLHMYEEDCAWRGVMENNHWCVSWSVYTGVFGVVQIGWLFLEGV